MKRENIGVNEYYHVYNRGVGKKIIFKDDRDRARFLFLILYFQGEVNFSQISRIISSYIKRQIFNVDTDKRKKIISTGFIELVGFALMPNHFHLILKESKEKGIGKYMQRVLNSYTKYFNTRYDISGHLFQGAYKAVHVVDNEQLLYLSAYIHRNPREIKEWHNKEENFPWSSYQDYTKQNRWGKFLKDGIILDQFKSSNDYRKFVETSGAKDVK